MAIAQQQSSGEGLMIALRRVASVACDVIRATGQARSDQSLEGPREEEAEVRIGGGVDPKDPQPRIQG